MGLVRGDRGRRRASSLELVRQVRRDGQIRETELRACARPRRAAAHVTARVAPLSSRLVLALVEDRTRERRVEAIRRDFVANVSHELKTPVGALNLLAEAVSEAADDPEAVHAVRRPDADRERAARPGWCSRSSSCPGCRATTRSTTPSAVDVDAIVDRGDRPSAHRRRRQAASTVVARRRARPAGPRQRRAGRASRVGNLVANAVAYSARRLARSSVAATRRRADGRHRRSPTRASASRPTRSTASSSGSTASTRPGTAPPAAPASACRSSSTSPPRTAARCGSGASRARARRSR